MPLNRGGHLGECMNHLPDCYYCEVESPVVADMLEKLAHKKGLSVCNNTNRVSHIYI